MADLTFSTVARCLERFNFERVHAMMAVADWKWSLGSGPDDFRVPTIQEVKDQAERLLYAAVREEDTVATGGLVASYNDKHERASLTLKFVAAETWQEYK